MYSNYKAEDFLEAPGFSAWVKKENRESELFWENWADQNPDKKPEIEKARVLILSMGVKEPLPANEEVRHLWKKIERGVAAKEGKKSSVRKFGRYKMAVAASIAAILAVSVLLNSTSESSNEKGISESIPVKMIEKFCPVGQKSTITLTDGTRIKLNSNSKLLFPETFSANSREVQLEGEAFFEVARDPSRPFTITSGNLKTRVLGTSFNIKAYVASNAIKVAVASGKVAVTSDVLNGKKNELTLLPNEMAVYSKTSDELIMTSFDKLDELAWKDGVLSFKNRDINQITKELAKWYGVTFVLDKKLNNDKDYTGVFDNKSLKEVLEGISFVFNFEFKIDNKVVTIN
ncbi:FecR domain-containing protein [Reichenbachiella sp. MALMAid0571]|uniref:FecR family protein n=1 Tax=Reichenbachiella sp. MALMAid0571 TaxID=3143939 RepID=UPI0032DE6029